MDITRQLHDISLVYNRPGRTNYVRTHLIFLKYSKSTTGTYVQTDMYEQQVRMYKQIRPYVRSPT
jgi:hypothetical protein